MRTFHTAVRETSKKPNGPHVQQLGVRVGYWPCLRAPFVQVAFGHFMYELWYGEPSYKVG